MMKRKPRNLVAVAINCFHSLLTHPPVSICTIHLENVEMNVLISERCSQLIVCRVAEYLQDIKTSGRIKASRYGKKHVWITRHQEE
jgi:hypothetical protein